MCKQILVIVSLFAAAAGARADESYYMILFGQQDRLNRVEASHTFATFTKVSGEGVDKAKWEVETHTISWMPRSLQIKLRPLSEEGVNLDLKESLANAKTNKAEVSMWGPFQIKKELYDLAVKQETRLKKGEVAYKLTDLIVRPEKATNCIHAVSDIDTEKGLLVTVTSHGNDASMKVLSHLSRWIVDSNEKHEWLSERLELGKEIVRRETQIKNVDGVKK
jgi:hypothetical protein